MSLYKPKAVYAASERQCTSAGGEVQVRDERNVKFFSPSPILVR